tara:strand:- start:8048 stop:8278 length:231 start_codon:yes stop_codon:yes gene_type:complete
VSDNIKILLFRVTTHECSSFQNTLTGQIDKHKRDTKPDFGNQADAEKDAGRALVELAAELAVCWLSVPADRSNRIR